MLSSTWWLYSIYNLVPQAAQLTCCAIAIVACFWAIDVEQPVKSFVLSLIAPVLTTLCFLSNAVAFVIVFPCIAVYGGASLFWNKRKLTVLIKLAVAAACIAIPVALGMVQYLIAALEHTAHFFFGQDFMQDRTSLDFASIFYRQGFLGKFLVVFGLLGAVYCALTQAGRTRAFAWTHVIATLVFVPRRGACRQLPRPVTALF
jgi:hypothetical protein